MTITSESQLRELYGFPKGRAASKVLPALEKHSIHFINTSPFFTIATQGKDGRMDVSPRGGSPGFVKIINEKQIMFPDSKGNNRLDGLVNIVETGRVGLLFFIAGIDETLRINGTAEITTDPEILAQFPNEKTPVKTCLIVNIEEIFLHCAKAFMRSKLWDSEAQTDPKDFPSIGEMLKDQLNQDGEPESREDMIKRYTPEI